jgi:hypothetical protein
MASNELLTSNRRSRGIHHREAHPSERRDGNCHGNLALAKRKSEGLGSSSSRCRPPILQCFACEGAERVAGNKMALSVERIVDGGVDGQEPLR